MTNEQSNAPRQRDNREYLRVKVASLAAEARIIRMAEAKQAQRRRDALARERMEVAEDASRVRHGLAEHRRLAVRREARSAQLALALLRGRTYRSVEPYSHEAPNWGAVERLVGRYGWVTGHWDNFALRVKEWSSEPERPRRAPRFCPVHSEIVHCRHRDGRFIAMMAAPESYEVYAGFDAKSPGGEETHLESALGLSRGEAERLMRQWAKSFLAWGGTPEPRTDEFGRVVVYADGEEILRARRANGRYAVMGEVDGAFFVQFGYEGGVVPEGTPVPVGGGSYGIESRQAAAEQYDAHVETWLAGGYFEYLLVGIGDPPAVAS